MTVRLTSVVSPRRRIFVFCRHYLIDDFRENVAPVHDEFDFEFLTDGSSPGTRDTRRAFYAALRSGTICPEIDASTEVDVISRCRLLRNINPDQARRMVHAMAFVLSAELDRVKPNATLCHWVDEYITHLLSLLSARRGVVFISYAFSYFPDRIQIVRKANGEALNVRMAEQDEIAQTLATISPKAFRQDYMQPTVYSRRRHAMGVMRYAVKRLVFAAKAMLERDPWNLHYSVTPYVVERRRFTDFPAKDVFETQWRERLTDLQNKRLGQPTIYMPLAYFPESTTDYWIANKSILNYNEMILKMARALAKDCIVVVKEHTHMIGARMPRLYDELCAIEGVVNVDPTHYSNEVLGACDAVVMGGGSVGVEAFLRNKPIFSYCHSSFWFEPARAIALDLDEIQHWSAQIKNALPAYRPLGDQERHAFIGECLRSTVRRRDGGRRWAMMHVDDLRTLLRGHNSSQV